MYLECLEHLVHLGRTSLQLMHWSLSALGVPGVLVDLERSVYLVCLE